MLWRTPWVVTVSPRVCVCVPTHSSWPQTLPSFHYINLLCPIISGLCGLEGQRHCSLDKTQKRKEAETKMFLQWSDLITHRVTISKPSYNYPHSALEPSHKCSRGLPQRRYWLGENCNCKWQSWSLFLSDCECWWGWRVWRDGDSFPVAKGLPLRWVQLTVGSAPKHQGWSLGFTICKLHDVRYDSLKPLCLSILICKMGDYELVVMK